MRCLQCGKRVSLLRKLTDGEFCSDEHRQLFQQQQNDLALARLIEAQQGMSRPRRQATPAPAKPQPKSASKAAPEEKIPPFGDFLKLHVAALMWRRIHAPELTTVFPFQDSSVPAPEFRTLIQGVPCTGGVPIGLSEALGLGPGWIGFEPAWLSGLPQLELPAYSCDLEKVALTIASTATAAASPADPPMADLMGVGVFALGQAENVALAGEVAPALMSRSGGRRLPVRDEDENAPAPLADLLPVRLVVACMRISRRGLTITLAPIRGHIEIPILRLAAEPATGLPSLDSVLALAPGVPARRLPRELTATVLKAAAWPEAGAELPFGINPAKRLSIASATRLLPVGQGQACTAEPVVRAAEPATERRQAAEAAQMPAATLQTHPFDFWAWLEQQTKPEEESLPPVADLASVVLPSAAQSPAMLRSETGEESLGEERFRDPAAALPPLQADLSQEPFQAVLEHLTAPVAETSEPAWQSEAAPLLDKAAMAAAEPAPLALEEAGEGEPEEVPPPLVSRLNPILVWRLCEPPPVEVRVPALEKNLLWGSAFQSEPGLPRLSLRPDNAERAAKSSEGEKAKKREERSSLLSRIHLPESWKVWKHAPADLKWVAVGLPLILALVLYSFRGSQPKEEAGVKLATSQSQSILGGQFASLQKVIMQRAAIHLLDDFRGGLSAWDGKPGWAKSWKYGQATFLEPGQLAVYKPTLQMKDYTLEFLGQIERQGLSWVVRADADLKNYHVLRLAVTRPGPLPEAAIVRYTVVDGKEGPVTTLPLPFPIKLSTMYRVRVEVSGKEITTYVQGQVVDSFTDTRLRGGGVGFFSAKGEKALLRWVEVTHQYDYLGRFCAVLAPYDVQAGAERAD